MPGIQPVNTIFNTLFASENQYQYSGLGLRLIHKYIYKAVLRIDYGINSEGFKNASLVFSIDQFFLIRVSILYWQSWNL